MHKFNSRLMLSAVLAASLVAACGGGDDVDPATQVGQSVMKTIDFIKNLIVDNGENSDPIDIAPLTLAVDDTAEPTSLE